MNVTATKINGAYIVERTPFEDERGYFVRAFCRKELGEAGMNADFVQSNISGNYKKGTVRGMHAQKDGYEEEKLVGCTRGRMFDVCVDLRKDSETYLQYVGVELSEEKTVPTSGKLVTLNLHTFMSFLNPCGRKWSLQTSGDVILKNAKKHS